MILQNQIEIFSGTHETHSHSTEWRHEQVNFPIFQVCLDGEKIEYRNENVRHFSPTQTHECENAEA